MILAGLILLLLSYVVLVPSTFLVIITMINFAPMISVLYSKLILDTALSALGLMFILVGRSSLITADKDNLLAFGVKRRRMFSSFSLYVLLLVTPYFIFAAEFVEVVGRSYPLSAAYTLLPIAILLPAFIFLSVLTITRGTNYSFGILAVLTAINFSNLIGNPFSVGNISTPNYIYGLVAGAVFLVFTFYLALSSSIKLGFSKIILSADYRKAVVKSPIDFMERKGLQAHFWLWLWIGPIFRNIRSGNIHVSATRVTFGRQVIYNSAIFIIVALMIIFSPRYYGPGTSPFSFLFVFISTYGFVIAFTISFGPSFNSISHERLWVSLGSMVNGPSVRTHLIARSMATFITILPALLTPFVLAIAGLWSYFSIYFYYTLLLTAGSFPAIFITQVINTYLSPEQITDDTIPQQGVLVKFIGFIPELFLLISSVIGIFFHYYLIWAFAVLLIFFLPLLFSRSIFDNAATSMLKRGFA